MSDLTDDRLEPCPFCGYALSNDEGLCIVPDKDEFGDEYEDGRTRLSGVCCPGCAAFLPLDNLPLPEAIAAWNRRAAASTRTEGAGVKALGGKYGDVLTPFVTMMESELHANSGKGDRPGWLAMSRQDLLLEIHYHLAKLQKATLKDDADGIREFGADVANMSMMLVDKCEVLNPPAPKVTTDEAEERG